MLQILEAKLGPEHPDLLNLLTNLSGLYDNIGECEQARPLYQMALEISEKVLGPNIKMLQQP